jgi:Eco29kI restriction endonuclease
MWEDPPPELYDPLSEPSLRESLRRKLEEQQIRPFPPLKFYGAGLYALYYAGDLAFYAGIKGHAPPVPIYVGRAAAGRSSYGRPRSGEDTTNLWDRIKDHSRSIGQATENLRTEDFRVQYLVMSDAWITLGELALLRAYYPVLWNTFVTGFGSNAAGTGRENGRSIWDTLHGGRKRARKFPPNRFYTRSKAEQLVAEAVALFLTRERGSDMVPDSVPKQNRRAIWTAGKDGEPLKVHDEARYLAEMKRLGQEVPNYVLDENAPQPDELLSEEQGGDEQG